MVNKSRFHTSKHYVSRALCVVPLMFELCTWSVWVSLFPLAFAGGFAPGIGVKSIIIARPCAVLSWVWDAYTSACLGGVSSLLPHLWGGGSVWSEQAMLRGYVCMYSVKNSWDFVWPSKSGSWANSYSFGWRHQHVCIIFKYHSSQSYIMTSSCYCIKTTCV